MAAIGLTAPGLAFAQDSEEERPPESVDEIVVTGSSLNLAPSQMSKDVHIIDSDELAAIGEPTLGRVLARLPQNFGALGDTVSYANTSRDTGPANGAANVGAAATVNLRGLGNDATLILVNGRRMGLSGIQGGLQDISNIPMSFVERIEIILDGASAIYGADAIGGVVNIITKKSAETITADLRYTAPVESGNNEVNADITGGTSWGSGNVIMSLSSYNQTSLNRADLGLRDGWSSGESFSTVSGTLSRNAPFLSPPSVYFLDDETYWQQTDPTDLNPDVSGLTELADLRNSIINPEDVAPETQSLSLNMYLRQELGNRTSLNGRIGYTTKEVIRQGGYNGTMSLLEADNPWNPTFGNPSGGPEPEAQRVTLRSYYPELGTVSSLTETDAWSADLGMDISLSDNWALELGASYSYSDYDYASRGKLDLFRAAQDEIFNPWSDGTGNINEPYSWTDPFGNTIDGTVLDYLGRKGNSVAWSKTDDIIFDAKLRGDLFELPAGPLKAIVGVEYRDSGLRGDSYRFGDGVATPRTTQGMMDASQDAVGLFVETFVPLIKDVPFVQELSLQGAFRTEEYTTKGQFGASSTDRNIGDDLEVFDAANGKKFDADTWMAGLVWSVDDTIRIKANYNTSFMAPDTVQLFKPVLETDWSVYCGLLAVVNGGIFSILNGLDPADPYPTNPLSGCYIPASHFTSSILPVNPNAFQSTPVLQLRGGNPDLKPQRGESRTITAEFFVTDSLTFRATFWKTTYYDKFVDPYSDYFRRPAAGSDLRDVFPQLFTYDEDTGNVLTIKSQTVNLDRQVLQGTDININFAPSTSFGDFSLQARWTIFDKNEAKLEANGDISTRNAVGIEAPKESGSVLVTWQHGGWYASMDSTYRDTTYDYDYFLDGETGMMHKSYWRSNMSVAYMFGERDSWLDRVTLRAGINNVFDSTKKSYYMSGGELVAETNRGFNDQFEDPRRQTFYVSFGKEFL